MLILKRRVGDKVDINHEVKITVLDVCDDMVTLGFTNPVENGELTLSMQTRKHGNPAEYQI